MPDDAPRRLPPILIALPVAVVLVVVAIVYGLTGGRQPLPHCTPTPGVTAGPLACTTPTVTP